jgi:DNA replication initiation complex subunit (GINS family)
MKRKLTDDEKELTEKNVNKLKEEIIELEESLNYNLLMKNQMIPHQRKVQDKQVDVLIEELNERIKQNKWAIEESLKQIKGGVEIKDG